LNSRKSEVNIVNIEEWMSKYSSPIRARFVNVIDCQRKSVDEVATKKSQQHCLKELRDKLKIALKKSTSTGEDSTPISNRSKRGGVPSSSTRTSSPNKKKRSAPRSDAEGTPGSIGVRRSSNRLLELGN
jgi:hypothetical protein